MAAGIDTAAGIVAFVTIAYNCTKSLCDTLKGIRNASTDVSDIKSDLGILLETLEVLRSSARLSNADTGLVSALDSCKTACERFQTLVERYQKHGRGQRDSTRDGIAWELNSREIKDFKLVLSSVKETMAIAVGVANLDASRRKTADINDLRASITSALEAQKLRLDSAVDKLELLLEAVNTSPIIQSQEALVEEIKQCMAFCQQASELTQGHIDQEFGHITVSNDSKSFAGASYSANQLPQRVRQTTKDISISGGSQGMVGFVDAQSLSSFWSAAPQLSSAANAVDSAAQYGTVAASGITVARRAEAIPNKAVPVRLIVDATATASPWPQYRSPVEEFNRA